MSLSQRQEAMLRSMLDGAKRYEFIDLRTFNALKKKGLAYEAAPGGELFCYVSCEGKDLLAKGNSHD